MSNNLKSTICSYEANSSSAMNLSQVDKKGRASYKATVDISGNNEFQIRSYLQEIETINKLGRNLLTIKKCCEILGESVEHLNFSELECTKYFNNETIEIKEFLDTATNTETDKRECVSLQNKIIDDVNLNSDDPDFKDSATKGESNSRKNEMLTKKKKTPTRGKRRKCTKENKNTSDLSAEKSQTENREETVDTVKDISPNIEQLSCNRGIDLKNKSENCAILPPDIKERRGLFIKKCTENMKDMVSHTRKLYFDIDRYLEERKWFQLSETLVAYDMTLYFACREQGRKRHTESEWRKLYGLQEQQYKDKNEEIFKDISENPIVNPEKSSDDNSENINVFLENLSIKKKLQMKNKLIDKKSMHDDIKQSGVAEQIQSDVGIENQPEDTLTSHSNGTSHEKQLNVTLKFLSCNFGKGNPSNILTLILAEDNFHKNKLNVNLGSNYISDQDTQSNVSITIPHEVDKKNLSKLVGKIHVNEYKPGTATEFNPNQENQSNVAEEVNSETADLGSLPKIVDANNDILRACTLKMMYEEQESVMNSLGEILENTANSGLELAFKEFKGICNLSCTQFGLILNYINQFSEDVFQCCQEVMKDWEAKSNNFKEQHQHYLNEAKEYYEWLYSAYSIGMEARDYLSNLATDKKQLPLQDSYSLISNGIFLHKQFYSFVVTVGIIIQRYLEYANIFRKFKELMSAHKNQ